MYYVNFGMYIFMLPAVLIAIFAQFKVKSTFSKYSNVKNRNSFSGAQAANMLLTSQGIRDVQVAPVSGDLTDHYDPTHKVLRLSERVYNSNTISAVAVAAHETGHAIQDQTNYIPMRLRSGLVPILNFGSQIAPILVALGFFISSKFGTLLINLGIIVFLIAFLFHLVTLPVELNASNRALKLLESEGILTYEEIKPAKSVLTAAALTYVASTITALLQLVYLVLRARRRNDD